MGPLPRTMRPLTRHAPWIAVSLTRLIQLSQAAGLRVVLWQDTTPLVREVFRKIQERMAAVPVPDLLQAYLTTLQGPAGRTGLFIAQRV
jgi:hypothetical protein